MVNGNCAVVGCTNSNYRLKAWKEALCEIHAGFRHNTCSCEQPFRLFKFPSKQRNHERRKIWITKLKRQTAKKKRWEPGQSDMVCSDHFVDGCPTIENPDPTVHLGYEPPVKRVRRQLVRHYADEIRETVESPLPSVPSPSIPQEEATDSCGKCDQCDEVKERAVLVELELARLKEENSKLKKRIQTLSRQVISKKKKVKPFSHRRIRSDAKMKFYTGIQTIAIFNVIFNMIKPCLSSMVYWRGNKTVSPSKQNFNKKRLKHILPYKDQFLIVLMRLRLGLMNEDLADRFFISPSLCSNIFITWIKMLAKLLGKTLITWLPRDVIKNNLPEGFKKISPKTQCIIDCTEVFIERSKSLNVQASTWSDYKKHNTVKFLVAISPHGYIMLLSDCYGGRTTDQYICANSNLYSHLVPGDDVMADRGFQIKEDLLHYHCTLNVPPGARAKSQMTPAECTKTKKVANLRIHVERAINRIKEFKILKNTMPINMLPLADDIVHVCGALCNLQPCLIKSK